MHWGTFDLTDEPMDLPPKVLLEEVGARGGDRDAIHVLAIGETFELTPTVHAPISPPPGEGENDASPR